MDEDPEIQAMSKIATALSDLTDSEARTRVLRWAVQKYQVRATAPLSPARNTAFQDIAENTGSVLPREFPDFPALFATASPATDAERALVAGYWFQVINGQGDLHGQQLNDELKNMGHRIGNVTDALSSLIARRPALVIQTRKSGTSRQARKKYRLTTEGVRAVEQMLSRASQPEPVG